MPKYVARYFFCVKLYKVSCFHSWNYVFLRFGHVKFHTNAFYLHSNENPSDSREPDFVREIILGILGVYLETHTEETLHCLLFL